MHNIHTGSPPRRALYALAALLASMRSLDIDPASISRILTLIADRMD